MLHKPIPIFRSVTIAFNNKRRLISFLKKSQKTLKHLISYLMFWRWKMTSLLILRLSSFLSDTK